MAGQKREARLRARRPGHPRLSFWRGEGRGYPAQGRAWRTHRFSGCDELM